MTILHILSNQWKLGLILFCDLNIPKMTRIKLDEDRIWLVPLSSLVEPCFVTYNYNYCDRQNENDKCKHDSTAIVIKSMSKWSDLFIG